MQSPEEAVLIAIEKLPMAERQRSRVGDAAKMLCISAALMPMNDRPHLRKAGSRAASVKLDSLAYQLTATAGVFNSLSSEAIDAIQAVAGRHAFQMQAAIEEIARQLDQASKKIPASHHRSGRHANRDAVGVAKAARVVFEELTERRATVSTDPHAEGNPARGKFLEFVRAIFIAFEIEASAETYARRAVKEKSLSKIDQ